MKQKINIFYDKHYKNLLIIPILLILTSIFIIAHTYYTTGDFIHKDVSLTGGTTIIVSSDISIDNLKANLSNQISNFEVRSLLDNNGKQIQIVIITSDSYQKIGPIIENYLGYKLTDKNSSVESTGSNLSKDFYKQLMIAIMIAFFWMAAVVFIIFAPKIKIKILAIVLNIILGIFLGKFFNILPGIISIPILIIIIFILIFVYIKNSIPSFAVMSCAFADIIMTLAVADFIGMKISGAGIVAFLMLIGYSVDTDILLTTRVLKRVGTSVNREIFGAFKTGMTMTLTAIAAVAVALFFIYSFGTSLNQIFTILLIGLSFDILNTWITNTSLIKWFVEKKS